MASTFHVEHFGCRAARADGEAVSGRLRGAGLGERTAAAADVVVVNTCSVTAEADRAARAFIRRAHRLNPAARIVVTGCYAQRAPEELAGLAGVAAVVGNSHKALAPEIILDLTRVGRDIVAPSQLVSVELLMASRVSRASARGLSESLEEHPSGAKAPADSLALMYELKPVPFIVASLSAVGQAPIWADDRFAHSFLEEEQLAPGTQTRPNLKIQEGCGNRCSFCVIPQTRGSSRSLPGAAVLKQVEGFVAAGGNELVLSGINLGRWGRDLSVHGRAEGDLWYPTLSAEKSGKDGARGFGGDSGGEDLWTPTLSPESRNAGSSTPVAAATFAQNDGARGFGGTLAGLVREIFEGTRLPRLRLSSIEPMDWDAELIGLMAEFGNPKNGRARLAHHAHLPLQSGSDAVLRRMRRRYRPWHYTEKVEALVKAAGPELTLGADVMVGFPGETDGEFIETLELVRKLPFGYLHLFPFSPRPGTRGWALHAERPVPDAVVEERMAALRALAAEKSETHRRRFVGRELEAITLHTPEEVEARGRTAVLTENFLPVEIEGRWPANRLARVRVSRLTAKGTLEAEGTNLF